MPEKIDVSDCTTKSKLFIRSLSNSPQINELNYEDRPISPLPLEFDFDYPYKRKNSFEIIDFDVKRQELDFIEW